MNWIKNVTQIQQKEKTFIFELSFIDLGLRPLTKIKVSEEI